MLLFRFHSNFMSKSRLKNLFPKSWTLSSSATQYSTLSVQQYQELIRNTKSQGILKCSHNFSEEQNHRNRSVICVCVSMCTYN